MGLAIGNPKKVQLRVSRKPVSKVSADEPADTLQGSANIKGQGETPNSGATTVQGGRYNPGNIELQDPRGVQSPQVANSSVNAKMKGLKGAIKRRLAK